MTPMPRRLRLQDETHAATTATPRCTTATGWTALRRSFQGDLPWPQEIGLDPTYGSIPHVFDSPGQRLQEAWFMQQPMTDSSTDWHDPGCELGQFNGYAGLRDVALEPLGLLQPGTPEFQEAFDAGFNRLIAAKNNEGEGGTRFL